MTRRYCRGNDIILVTDLGDGSCRFVMLMPGGASEPVMADRSESEERLACMHRDGYRQVCGFEPVKPTGSWLET